MIPKHPVDELFRQQLEQHTVDVPAHLWEGVQARQAAASARAPRAGARRLVWLMAASTVCLSAAVWWWYAPRQSEVQIGSFPIHLAGTAVAAAPEMPLAHTEEAVAPGTRSFSVPSTTSVLNTAPSASQTARPELLATIETVPLAVPASPAAELSPPVPALAASPVLATLWPTAPTTLPSLSLGDPRCAQFNGLRWDLYVEAIAAPEWAFRNMSAIEPEYNNYTQQRRDTERAALSYSMGARLAVVSNTGVAFRTGLHYTSINEQFKYVSENEERIITTIIRDSDGNVLRTDTTRWTGTREKLTNNRYRLIDVPLLAGYEWSYKKVKWMVHAGALFNLSLKARGDFLSPADLQPASFTHNQPGAFPAYEQQIGIGAYAGLGLVCPIGNQLDLLAEVGMRYYPASLANSSAQLQHRYALSGLNIGIRKKI